MLRVLWHRRALPRERLRRVGVPTGVAVCFDEWANDVAEHGIQMFYNGEMIYEGRADCENQAGCAPVSYFNDGSWHSVMVNLLPDGTGDMKVTLGKGQPLCAGCM